MTTSERKNTSDEQIREQIHERLTQEPGLPVGQLTIEVGDGIVTLSGEVASEETRGQLTELVETVPNVKGLRTAKLKVVGS